MTATPPGEQPTDPGQQVRYTDDELLDGIGRALAAKDWLASAPLIRRLAVQNPDAAQVILDGLSVSRSVSL